MCYLLKIAIQPISALSDVLSTEDSNSTHQCFKICAIYKILSSNLEGLMTMTIMALSIQMLHPFTAKHVTLFRPLNPGFLGT